MALRLNDKKVIVDKFSNIAMASTFAMIAEYRGLTVEKMTKLRSELKDASIHVQVIRNTLARRALEDTHFACMKEAILGPLVFFFSKEDLGLAARLIRNFAKENENFILKALSMDGKLLDAKSVDAFANLPSREQALSMLLSVMKAPISRFVCTVREPVAKCVRAFSAVGEHKKQT